MTGRPPRGGVRAGALLGACALVASWRGSGVATAADAPAVTLTVRGPAPENLRHVAALRAALTPPLAGLSTALGLIVRDDPGLGLPPAPTGTPDERRLVAMFWLDVRDAQEWRLFIADPRSGRTVVRFLTGPARDAAAVEAVGAVVSQATASLLQSPDDAQLDRLGTPVLPPAAPAVSPAVHAAASPRPTRSPWLSVQLGVGAGYRGETFDARYRSGVAVSALAMSGRHRLALTYVATPGVAVEAPEGRFRVDTQPLELAFGRQLVDRRVALWVKVCATGERRVRTRGEPAIGYTATSAATSFHGGAGAGVDLTTAIGRGWTAYLGASAVHFFREIDVVVRAGDSAQSRFSPEATRVRTDFGLSYRFL